MTRRGLLSAALAFTGTTVGADRACDEFAQRIFMRINELRVSRGVNALIWSRDLGRCALEQSIRKEQLRFPGHTDPERGGVSERLNAAGIQWARCGENVFQERGYDDPVHFAVVFWWYSPGHQENMLNPEYTLTGLGVTKGHDGTFFVTQIFTLPLLSRGPGRQVTPR